MLDFQFSISWHFNFLPMNILGFVCELKNILSVTATADVLPDVWYLPCLRFLLDGEQKLFAFLAWFLIYFFVFCFWKGSFHWFGKLYLCQIIFRVTYFNIRWGCRLATQVLREPVGQELLMCLLQCSGSSSPCYVAVCCVSSFSGHLYWYSWRLQNGQFYIYFTHSYFIIVFHFPLLLAHNWSRS